MKKVIILISILVMLCLSIFVYLDYSRKKDLRETKLRVQEKLKKIELSYNELVKTKKDSFLYSKDLQKLGKVYEGNYLFLDAFEDKTSEYFKIKDQDLYIKYEDVEASDNYKVNDRYKKYVYFDLEIVTKKSIKLYKDNEVIYELNYSIQKQVIRKNNEGYYIEFNDELLFVRKEDVESTVSSEQKESASDIPVMVYHFIHPDEDKKCNQIICHSVTQVKTHFNYLKENNYLTIDTNELELFFDKEIRLPKNSILITIDDGWYAENIIPVLNEYEFKATLFLITSWYDKNNFASPYLEVASHTHDLHTPNICPGGQGSPLKCLDKVKVLEDLKKSREALNNTTSFCYPFYEYNSYSENILKEAGFKLAFIGGQKKANINTNKLRIQRITLFNDTSLKEFINYIK